MDVLPTSLGLADAELPPGRNIDGTDLMPFLEGRELSPHSEFFYYNRRRLCAVRSGPWKLHMPRKELYHLERDPSESIDLAAAHPEVVERLAALAGEFRHTMFRGKLPPPRWRSVAL
jgi:arylsulfatase A-like enzyme